ncbi:hypothetical protein ACO2FM_04490 [Staphylococcus pasteuri]
MITSSVFAITGDLAPSSKKGLWLSIATSGFLTSIWIGAPLGNLLSNITNWRTVFFISFNNFNHQCYFNHLYLSKSY